MDRFYQVFGEFLEFVYHCFDRIVVNGYLTGLMRPEQVVYFFREVLGHRAITPEVLRQRTDDYQRWVEAYARNHHVPIEWAEKGVRKEEYVLPWLHRMERRKRTASTSSSRAWNKGRRFARSCRRFPPPIPITASYAQSAAGSRTITSPSATTCGGR